MCDVKNCKKPTKLTCTGVELCDAHWEDHCDNLSIPLKKGKWLHPVVPTSPTDQTTDPDHEMISQQRTVNEYNEMRADLIRKCGDE